MPKTFQCDGVNFDYKVLPEEIKSFFDVNKNEYVH